MSEVGYDECGCGFSRPPVPTSDKPRPSSPDNDSTSSSLPIVINKTDSILYFEGKEFVPMRIHRGAKNQEYISPDKRMETFATWPDSAFIKPEKLVEAGFYYLGEKDICKCFYCEGGLQQWDKGDSPWIEHAKHFPDCLYVFLNKGEDFIKKARSSMTQNAKEKQANKSIGPSDIANQSDTNVSQVGNESQIKEEITSLLSEQLSLEEKVNNQPNESRLTKSNQETSLLCIICAGKDIGVVFYPCGHAVSCAQCAPALKTCVVCRKKIISMLRFHLLC